MTSDLEAKDAIRESIAKYCLYVDDRRVDDWCALFTEDCVWDGGERIGRFNGKAEIRAFTESLPGVLGDHLHHSVANHIITLNGDRAHLTAYFDVIQAGEEGPKILAVGTYDVNYVRQGGAWLIEKMVVSFPG